MARLITKTIPLGPAVAGGATSPGHIVGFNLPHRIFVLRELRITIANINMDSLSHHTLSFLLKNPADFPSIDSATGITPLTASAKMDFFAIFAIGGRGGAGGPHPQVPVWADIDEPLVNNLVGLYGHTGQAFSLLQYWVHFRGTYEIPTRSEGTRMALAGKEPITEIANASTVQWDVHLPT